MQVNEIMTRYAECIAPDACVQEAAERMKALDIGALPVCEDDRILGMVTDRDIAIRCVAEGKDACSVMVRDIMTPQVIYCFEDQDVTEAAKLMHDKQVRRLPVLNRRKRLTGIVSIGDLAVEDGNEQLVGEALEGISEPASPMR